MRGIAYSQTQLYWRNIKLFMLFWTLVFIASLIWNLYSQRQSIEASLHTQAAAIHGMEMEYRNWMIQSGGVYVPVSDKIQPNPWLSHVPERDIKTPSGKLLTLLNSSYVVRLVHENMRTSGSTLRDHIASPKPINPANAADTWERQAIEAFGRGDKESASFDVLEDGKTYYRYMKPMVTEESCLKCHARFGDKLGDIRGGVSVAIPVDVVMLAGRSERNAMVAGHGLIWGLGLIGLFVGGRKQQQAIQAVEKSEEALRTNEERLHLATTAGNVGIWDWDVARNELTWDESMYTLYGIRKEDFGGAYDAWIRTLHPDDRQFADGEIQAALRGEREYAPEFRIIRPDGTVRNIKAACKTYRDPQGKSIRMVGTNIDITELKQAEATRTQLAAIVESSNDAIVGKTTDGIITSWNKGAEIIYSYSADEIIGKHITTLAPPSHHAEINELLEKIRKGGMVANHESERIRKDGTLIHVALTLSPIRDASGNITGISTIARDITEKKRMEEELLHASVYTRSLIEASMDPMVTISVAGKITDVNQATEKVTGKSRSELIGADFSNYFTEPAKAREGYQQVFAKGFVTDYLLTIRHVDGRLTDVLYNATVYKDAAGKVLGVFAAARDVTVQKRAEEELKRYKDQLEEKVALRTNDLELARNAAEAANRAKSVFLSSMSHELRTPLNAILGFSSLMRKDPLLAQEQRENLDIINRSGEHLLTLINDVLEMAKIEAGRVQLESAPFDLGGMVRDVTDMMHVRAQEKGLQLLVDQSSEFPRYIKGDEARVRQVLINLLGNAVKFTRQGGVTVRFGMKPHAIPPRLLIEVEDSGSGISEADQQKIFEPFVQLGQTTTQQGTGLGLTITRQFVQLMGGTISVESTQGKGSTFRVELPAEKVAASDVVKPENVVRGDITGLVPGQPEYRILIVEDQLENQLLLSKLMKSVGFLVKLADNGLLALELFNSWRPHLIWMDRRMPVMDGVEATRRIRELPGGTDVKIVAVTASAFAEQRVEMLDAGMDDFVRKPYRFNEIYECLTRQLGVQYTYSDAPAAEEEVVLTAKMLAVLPPELRLELRDALVSLVGERISAVIGQVASHDSKLHKTLLHLAENFDYPAILKALGKD
ncbi:MAG: PAS domain S-box protein [Gallionella sp.]|nr:PAS domain S-box protein [Gallionella sp.]